MKSNGRVDWAAVRHAYCAGGQTVGEICHQHGISITGLYLRRRKEDWPQRHRPSAGPPRTSKQIHKSKVERLYQLLDRLMKEIEMEPMVAADNEGGPKTATADRERSARTLSSLIRSFEKIKELEAGELSKTGETDDGVNEADEKEAEQLRNILYEKIAKLTQAGDS